MSVQFIPFMSNLVIKLEPTPSRSKILAMPGQMEDMARFAEVVSVGPEVRDIRKGQRVLASITAGVELQAGVVMIAECSVLAVT